MEEENFSNQKKTSSSQKSAQRHLCSLNNPFHSQTPQLASLLEYARNPNCMERQEHFLEFLPSLYFYFCQYCHLAWSSNLAEISPTLATSCDESVVIIISINFYCYYLLTPYPTPPTLPFQSFITILSIYNMLSGIIGGRGNEEMRSW